MKPLPGADVRKVSIASGRAPQVAAFPKGFFDAIVGGRMSLFEWIELAGRLELDGLELYPRFLTSDDVGYLAKVRLAAERHGLAIPMMCHSPDFTRPDPHERQREVKRTGIMLRVTAELGGSFCRVLSGQNRPGLREAETLEWVIDCLWELESVARSCGVVMCLENHYKDGLWTYPEFAQSHARYLRILDAVDSPWLCAQYDPSNALIAGEDQYALLDRVVPRTATVHASDRFLDSSTPTPVAEPGRVGYAHALKHGVVGEGQNDYRRIFKTLAAVGYAGWISIEDGEGPTVETGLENLRRSVRFLRRMIELSYGEDDD